MTAHAEAPHGPSTAPQERPPAPPSWRADDRPQVLVVGAGPTGLVLALWLARVGVRVRVVDAAAGPGTTSRAIIVHARTLEYYRQLGIAEAAINDGRELQAANLWLNGRKAAHVPFGAVGAGLSAYPTLLVYPQDAHERLLVAELARAGVTVERGTTCTGVDETPTGVRATLRAADGAEFVCEADYLAGCDGARSAVRDALGVGFPGGTYTGLFFVADVDASGPVVDDEPHAALDDDDLLLVFPLREPGRVRLIGRVHVGAGPHGADAAAGAPVGWDDVRDHVRRRVGITVTGVRWFSSYRVHHRVAARFRRGRAFLLGDAGHIHSPVGGQGMNTGIGDAVNLAWKLAAVLQERAAPALLDSYEEERLTFARTLVATTDRAFTLLAAEATPARTLGLRVASALLPHLARSAAVRRAAFRRVSQIAIAYPESALSAGQAGQVAGGDRLPWVAGAPSDARGAGPGADDNFAPLAARDWQVHVYGAPRPALRDRCAARGLSLHAFPWTPAARRAGLHEGTAYLVRPDGYVGLVDARGEGALLDHYLATHGIRPAAALTLGAGVPSARP